MTLRPATPQDAEVLAALAALIPGAPTWPPYIYASLSTHPAKLLLTLHHQATLAGYAVAALLPPDEAELEAIAVHPGFQRQGHGSALLAAVQHWAVIRHVITLHLEVRASNHPAQRLYAAHGFLPAGRRTRYYSHPQEDAVLMQWTPVPPMSTSG